MKNLLPNSTANNNRDGFNVTYEIDDLEHGWGRAMMLQGMPYDIFPPLYDIDASDDKTIVLEVALSSSKTVMEVHFVKSYNGLMALKNILLNGIPYFANSESTTTCKLWELKDP
eukprot:Pgem_evm1s14797